MPLLRDSEAGIVAQVNCIPKEELRGFDGAITHNDLPARLGKVGVPRPIMIPELDTNCPQSTVSFDTESDSLCNSIRANLETVLTASYRQREKS